MFSGWFPPQSECACAPAREVLTIAHRSPFTGVLRKSKNHPPFSGGNVWAKACCKDFRNAEILLQHIYNGDEDQQKNNGDRFIKGLAGKVLPSERIDKVPAFSSIFPVKMEAEIPGLKCTQFLTFFSESCQALVRVSIRNHRHAS